MLGGGSDPPQRLHHMLGGGWGVSRRAPPSLEAMSACSRLELRRERRDHLVALLGREPPKRRLRSRAADLFCAPTAGDAVLPLS